MAKDGYDLIIRSINNPGHCLYFKDPGGIRFASTIVNTNKVFRIKRPKKVDRKRWEE